MKAFIPFSSLPSVIDPPEAVAAVLAAGALPSMGGPLHPLAARWISGGEPEALAAIDGPCWSDAGSGEDDAIHLYGFTWSGALATLPHSTWFS